MRETKFKAWDKIDKKNRIVTRMTFGLPATGHLPLIIHLDDGTENPVIRSIEDVDLLQFTGLKDKNGKEIYEGDILAVIFGGFSDDGRIIKATGFIEQRPVEWNKDEGIWWAGEYIKEASNNLYVIGNIYENPELLKKD